MKRINDNTKTEQIELKSFLKKKVISTSLKLKGKFLPISEPVGNAQKKLLIKEIYDMSTLLKYFYLIVAKNHSKKPAFRYFLAINLSSQSSDLLVNLARDYAIKYNLKLIQYSIFPKTYRISLLSLKEIISIEEYTNSIEILNNFKIEFRKSLDKIKNLVENK